MDTLAARVRGVVVAHRARGAVRSTCKRATHRGVFFDSASDGGGPFITSLLYI
jgi:hypothetical protein